MKQFVRVSASGRVSVISTTGAAPVASVGEVLIETTAAPVPRGVDVSVVDGVVVTAARATPSAPGWSKFEEPPA